MNGKVIEERSINYTSYKDYVKIPFLFQGQYYDEEIKLAYNRFRYYDPQMGRFIPLMTKQIVQPMLFHLKIKRNWTL